jgi:hypothetical protein
MPAGWCRCPEAPPCRIACSTLFDSRLASCRALLCFDPDETAPAFSEADLSLHLPGFAGIFDLALNAENRLANGQKKHKDEIVIN